MEGFYCCRVDLAEHLFLNILDDYLIKELG